MPVVTWKKATVQVPEQMLDVVCDFMATLTGRGVCTRDDNGVTLIDAYLEPDRAGEQLAQIHRYLDDLADSDFLKNKLDILVDEVPEEDWMSVFRSQHQPIRISERLLVRPAWCDPVSSEDLILDPGMAFGTGSHFTTRMCLELLDGVPDLTAGGRMLDIGTGSGILAIAGAFLGMDNILAVDIDPVAVKVAAGNVRTNRVDTVVSVREGSVECAEGVYDIITANLSGSLLLKLAERISRHLVEKGHLIVSGVMSNEKDSVIESFAQCGLKTVQVVEEDVWIAGLFRRKI